MFSLSRGMLSGGVPVRLQAVTVALPRLSRTAWFPVLSVPWPLPVLTATYSLYSVSMVSWKPAMVCKVPASAPAALSRNAPVRKPCAHIVRHARIIRRPGRTGRHFSRQRAQRRPPECRSEYLPIDRQRYDKISRFYVKKCQSPGYNMFNFAT